jgi:hypothetical protein
MANSTIRFSGTIATNGGCSAYVDGSAIAFFRRCVIYSASGQQLSSVDQLNRLQNCLEDIEYNRSTCHSYRSILEGTATQRHRIRISMTGVTPAFTLNFYLNDQYVDGLLLVPETATNVKTIKVGEFTFAVAGTDAAPTVAITHLPTGQTVTIAPVAGATAEVAVGPITAGSITANVLTIAGCSLATGDSIAFEYIPQVLSQSNIINSSGAYSPVKPADPTGTYTQTEVFYELPMMTLLSSLNVYLPLFLSPAGYYFEFTLDSDRNALLRSNNLATSTATFSLDNVAIHCPVIAYDNAVMSSMVDMVNKIGMIKMSGVDWTSQIVAVPSAQTEFNIPLGFKYKSLKSILFFAQAQAPANFVFAQSSRQRLPITQFFLQSGTAVYPQQPVRAGGTNTRNRNGELIMELLKSVSKLSDIRLGTKIDKDNYGLTQAQGGTGVYGLDLESSQAQAFLKSGLNNSSSAEQLYLNISLGAGGAGVDSTLFIFACYDSDIVIMANRDVISER